VKPVTRTATATAYDGVDTGTGELLSGAALSVRVGWLASMVAGVGQQVLDAHWNAPDLAAMNAPSLPGGREMPRFAFKAVAGLWGWAKVPAGVYAPSRVVWMGHELAGRQLRSASYRAAAVAEVVAGLSAAAASTDVVTYRNTARQVGGFYDVQHRPPVDLFELAPAAPRIPAQVPLAASDTQFSHRAVEADTVTITVLLPHCAAPASRAQWTWVEMMVRVSERYAPGVVKAVTLRPQATTVRVDVPVDLGRPDWAPGTGVVLGLDWGVRRLLTGAITTNSPEGIVTDGRPLFFDAGPLMAKVHRLRTHREQLRSRAAHLDNLLGGKPDPALQVRRDVLITEADRCDRKQRALSGQVAELAAQWAVAQAWAAGASVIGVEDLSTMEHRGLGRRTNTRVSMGLRGQTRACIEAAAVLYGIRVVDVVARGTSAWCPLCDKKLTHHKTPGGPFGHPWALCPGCGWTADRDHSAAIKIGARTIARTTKGGANARAVRVLRSKRTRLTAAGRTNAPPRPPLLRGKTRPTPKRPVSTTQLSSPRAGRVGTPRPPLRVGNRSVGPDTQDTLTGAVQCRKDRTAPLPIEGTRWAYRGRLRATPELHARSRSFPTTTTHSAKLKS
jgi:transposase